jgi:hypothetical protein
VIDRMGRHAAERPAMVATRYPLTDLRQFDILDSALSGGD